MRRLIYLWFLALLLPLSACDSGMEPLDDDEVVIVDPDPDDPDDDPAEEPAKSWVIRSPDECLMHLNADWNMQLADAAQVRNDWVGWENSNEFAPIKKVGSDWVYEWSFCGDIPANTFIGFTWTVNGEYAKWGVDPSLLSEEQRDRACINNNGEDVLLFFKSDHDGIASFPGCPAGWKRL